jgi:hypothetical protein
MITPRHAVDECPVSGRAGCRAAQQEREISAANMMSSRPVFSPDQGRKMEGTIGSSPRIYSQRLV